MLRNTIASIKDTFGTKLVFFSSKFLVTTARFLILAKAFRNDYVAVCGTARRSATETNELSGCVTVPCSSKMTQHNSTTDWLNF